MFRCYKYNVKLLLNLFSFYFSTFTILHYTITLLYYYTITLLYYYTDFEKYDENSSFTI
jgi:hypothetical protein